MKTVVVEKYSIKDLHIVTLMDTGHSCDHQNTNNMVNCGPVQVIGAAGRTDT